MDGVHLEIRVKCVPDYSIESYKFISIVSHDQQNICISNKITTPKSVHDAPIWNLAGFVVNYLPPVAVIIECFATLMYPPYRIRKTVLFGEPVLFLPCAGISPPDDPYWELFSLIIL